VWQTNEPNVEADVIPPSQCEPDTDDDDNDDAIPGQQPVVFNRDQETLTTSRHVAKVYGKLHKDVLRAIDDILETVEETTGAEFRPSFLFRETVYTAGNGEYRRMFEMNEQAFILLVSGFTGQAALRLRIAYITEFERMKAALRAVPFDWNDPRILREHLIEYTKKLEESRAETAEQKAGRIRDRKQAAADRVAAEKEANERIAAEREKTDAESKRANEAKADADNLRSVFLAMAEPDQTMLLTDAASGFRWKAKDFFDWCETNDKVQLIKYRRSNGNKVGPAIATEPAQEKGLMVMVMRPINLDLPPSEKFPNGFKARKLRPEARLTMEGYLWIHSVLPQSPHTSQGKFDLPPTRH
jgi:Rha family phage regulatory protein